MSEIEDNGADLTAIGNRITEVRGDRKKGAFAEYLRVHPSTLKRYESGDRPPDAEFLLSLYFAENIDPYWVLTGEGSMKRGDGCKDFGNMDATELGMQAQALFKAINQLDDDRRFALLVLVLGHDAATAIFKPESINKDKQSDALVDKIVHGLMEARKVTLKEIEPHLDTSLDVAISTKPDAIAELLGLSFERFALAQKHIANNPALLKNANNLLDYIENMDMEGVEESKPQVKPIHETSRKNNSVQRASKSANHN